MMMVCEGDTSVEPHSYQGSDSVPLLSQYSCNIIKSIHIIMMIIIMIINMILIMTMMTCIPAQAFSMVASKVGDK